MKNVKSNDKNRIYIDSDILQTYTQATNIHFIVNIKTTAIVYLIMCVSIFSGMVKIRSIGISCIMLTKILVRLRRYPKFETYTDYPSQQNIKKNICLIKDMSDMRGVSRLFSMG